MTYLLSQASKPSRLASGKYLSSAEITVKAGKRFLLLCERLKESPIRTVRALPDCRLSWPMELCAYPV